MSVIEHVTSIVLGVLALIGTVLTTIYGPKLIKKQQNVKELNQLKIEGDASTEQMYITNMGLLLTEYKEQVSGFKEELREVRKEFSEFRHEQEKKTLEYENKINFLEIQIENKNDKIEELEVSINEYELAITEKETLILELKGGV